MKTIRALLYFTLVTILFFTLNMCNNTGRISEKPFGKTEDGKIAKIYTLTNINGLKTEITDFGGIVVSLYVPDKDGNLADIVLGYNNLDSYVSDNSYFGCIVGRYGNRIANGQFTLDSVIYNLAKNSETNGIPCHLHGGIIGFNKVIWNAEPLMKDNVSGLKLSYTSKDGEEGYPGNLEITVYYWLTNENELKIEYYAVADKSTPVNLTNHSYFNLKGEGEGDILSHILKINSDKITPVDLGLIPTGILMDVSGTPFDFTSEYSIGERINSEDQQIAYGNGYDHNWVLNKTSDEPEFAASVYEPNTGRYMEVFTTEPGVQLYCGNFLNGTIIGKKGKAYNKRNGFCLETQHYPDSPNQPAFPSTILKPGEELKSVTIYKFGIRN